MNTPQQDIENITEISITVSKRVPKSDTKNQIPKYCGDVLKETGVKTYKCIKEFCGAKNDKKCENFIFGQDARKIHESNEKYSKIYWSMPHDNSRYKTGTLPHLISDFCLSCSEAPKLGDNVHFIIAQVYKDDYSAIRTQFQQGIVYNIIEGPFIAGYTLEKRIHFKNNRYEGYKHQNTQGTITIDSGVGRMEFVFKKSGIILENYKNVASKFRRFCVIDLEGDDEDRINEYKIMIQSSYKNLLYFDIEGIISEIMIINHNSTLITIMMMIMMIKMIVNMNHLSRVYPLQTTDINYSTHRLNPFNKLNSPLPKCKAERHHKILFVGEGNFSLSTSLLKKHNQKFHTNDNQFLKITASDLYVCETVFNEFEDCEAVLKETGVQTYICKQKSCGIKEDKKCENCLLTIENINFLINSQCKVIFGLDATNIHESNEKYSKIYWSMPHDRTEFKTPSLPNLISNFCLSCSEVQKMGDNPFIAGYTLEKRLYFEDQRYKGYKHQQTEGTDQVENGNHRMEFVFKKSGLVLENYKNVALKLRSIDELDLQGNEKDRINDYKTKIESSYKNLKYYDKKGYKRYYIGDDDYIPMFGSDDYYDDRDDHEDDHDGSEDESFFKNFNNLSTSDNNRQL
ncbi:hypothetical protein ACTFIR_003501 [Dictyostelium discoideum]